MSLSEKQHKTILKPFGMNIFRLLLWSYGSKLDLYVQLPIRLVSNATEICESGSRRTFLNLSIYTGIYEFQAHKPQNLATVSLKWS
jgi:hypothetical protein